MIASTPEPTAAARPMPARLWLGLGGVALVVWLSLLGYRSAASLGATGAAAVRGLGDPAELRIQRASGISPQFVAALRAALPADGRLVLYSPYGGTEFEFLLRTQFERTKNLLYPTPRDVAFARNADELRAKIAPDLAGRLCVIDGTQEPVELTVGGSYELLHEERLGSVRLRVWRLRRAS